MTFRCWDASIGQHKNICILCNFIAEYSHIESLDDTVGVLCFCGGNMKFLIRKECLHYWQKENKKISKFHLYSQIWFRQVVLKKFEIPYLEMFITTKCNLRCKHCSNLIPTLNNRQNYEISTLIEWLDELLSKIDCLYRLKIHGGEVFLHPRLAEFVAYVKNQPKIKSIRLTTNGTIIPADNILQLIASSKIVVQISDYRLANIKTQQLIDKFKKFGVRYIYLKDQTWKDFGGITLRDGNRFNDCSIKRCSSFYEGKIYVCSRAAIMTESGYIPDDGISVYLPKNQLRQQLKKMYAGKLSIACNYCDGDTKYAKDISAGEQE